MRRRHLVLWLPVAAVTVGFVFFARVTPLLLVPYAILLLWPAVLALSEKKKGPDAPAGSPPDDERSAKPVPEEPEESTARLERRLRFEGHSAENAKHVARAVKGREADVRSGRENRDGPLEGLGSPRLAELVEERGLDVPPGSSKSDLIRLLRTRATRRGEER